MSLRRIAIYSFFSVLFVIESIYYVYNHPLVGDYLNYNNIYNNITIENKPFGTEFILSSLMFYFKSIFDGDFYQFMLIKQMMWIPVIILLTNKTASNNLFVLLICFSFLNPIFINTSLYLNRQSLSFLFLFISILSKNNVIKYTLLCFAIFSHISTIAFIPIYNKKIIEYIFSKKYILFLVCLLIIQLIGGSFFNTFVLILDFIANKIPFLAGNISSKLGFYFQNNLVQSSNSIYVQLLIVFCFLFLVYLYKVNSFSCVDNYCRQCCALYMLSLGYFILFYDNPILSNRFGFVSYFLTYQFIFIFISIYFSFKINKKLIFV